MEPKQKKTLLNQQKELENRRERHTKEIEQAVH